MAAIVSARFTNKFEMLAECELPQYLQKSPSRYNPSKTSHRDSTTQYRNYINLESELARLNSFYRASIVKSIIKRLSDVTRVANETYTRVLMYELRLQALVWAFFGGNEFQEVAFRDLSDHPGYDEVHSERESAIISGFYTAIANFRQGKIFAARTAFDKADKSFGELRHAEWLGR